MPKTAQCGGDTTMTKTSKHHQVFLSASGLGDALAPECQGCREKHSVRTLTGWQVVFTLPMTPWTSSEIADYRSAGFGSTGKTREDMWVPFGVQSEDMFDSK